MRPLSPILAAFLIGTPIFAAQIDPTLIPAHRISSGWDGRETQVNAAVSGKPLTFSVGAPKTGFGTHAPSEGSLLLDGKATRLVGKVGLDGQSGGGSVRFLVRGDGKTLFDSGVMRAATAPVSLNIPLAGVRRLTLIVDDAGDGNANDHANWGDLHLEYAGAAPVWFDASNPHTDPAYPASEARTPSPGGVTYYVDPVRGTDNGDGKTRAGAAKSFAAINRLKLAAGDTVLVAPGTHKHSLVLEGEGTEKQPITVKFLPGKHVFAHGGLFAERIQISNTNDRPNGLKPASIYVKGAKHVRLLGQNTDIYAEGKTIHCRIDHADGVTLEGLAFDYVNPTVCEFTVAEVGPNYADVKVHPDSGYRIENGRMIWQGAGWQFPAGGYAKVLDPKTGKFSHGFRTNGVTFEQRPGGAVRLNYADGKPDLVVGRVVQNRDITRDCTGFFQSYSRNIAWKNCAIHAMHGMGVVSQFSENLSFDNVRAEPRAGSGRTAVAWADILHFSGCRGDIRVKNCVLSCAHDDAINIHGTHLRIVETPAPDKIVVRFIHGQTYGFEAFFPGDEIDFIRHDALRAFGTAKVTAVKRLDDRRIELTLDRAAPTDIRPNDVVENATWTAAAHVSDTTVRNIPTRGFLLTTRKPVLIENCRFERTGMPAILVEDDASGWFESGFVRDMTLKGNTFFECAEPVISFHPQVKKAEGPVHSGVKIHDNRFEMTGGTAVRTHHTADVTVGKNTYLKNGASVDAKRAVEIR